LERKTLWPANRINLDGRRKLLLLLFYFLAHCFSTLVLHLLGLAQPYQSSVAKQIKELTGVKEAWEAQAWRQASQAFGTGTRFGGICLA